MKIELDRCEIGMVLCALEELPREEAAETIRRIEEQVAPPVIHCKDCVWFDTVESMPEAKKWHQKLHELFDGILPPRRSKAGICRKVTFSADHPVFTNSDGFCHRAERKEE